MLGIAIDRISVRLLKKFGRNFVANGFKQFKFAPRRQPAAGKLGAFEVAVDALVLIVENLFVHLLEIERIIESEPHARVLEFRPPDIEGKGLHHAGIADREFLEQHAFVGHRRKIVSGGPILRAILVAPVNIVGLEGFQRDGGVAEIDELQFVKIVNSETDV